MKDDDNPIWPLLRVTGMMAVFVIIFSMLFFYAKVSLWISLLAAIAVTSFDFFVFSALKTKTQKDE